MFIEKEPKFQCLKGYDQYFKVEKYKTRIPVFG